jgi:hypothetical protein
MYGGSDEPLHPVLGAVSAFFGAVAGLVFGTAGFFLATVFPAMLRTAMPGMSDGVFLGLWTAALAVPLIAFARVFRNAKGLGARLYASCGILVLTLLFAGELTGTVTVYPWHARFYVVPLPAGVRASAPPHAR